MDLARQTDRRQQILADDVAHNESASATQHISLSTFLFNA